MVAEKIPHLNKVTGYNLTCIISVSSFSILKL